jgi:AcrR family transcriptional regulator
VALTSWVVVPSRPSLRKSPRQARSRALVDAIVSAAMELVERDGTDFRLSDVAERAGVSPGSLYQYFPSREALLGALIDRQIETDRAALALWLPTLENVTSGQLSAALVDGILGLYGSRPRLFAGMLRALEELQRADDVRGLVAELCANLTDALGRTFPESSASEREKAAQAVVFAGLGIVRETVLQRPEELGNEGLRRLMLTMTESTFSALRRD